MDVPEEISRLEAAINQLERDYAEGLISVGEFSTEMVTLETALQEAQQKAKVMLARQISIQRWMRRWGPVILLAILNVVVRIPRVPHIQGYDGFVLAIESYSLIDGYAYSWLISPFSYLGVFSFSGYPIGSIATFSLCILVGGSLEAATFIYLSIFTVIGVFCSYLFFSQIFENERYRLVGVIFYLLLPTIYEFSYNSPTARIPFIALTPLFLLFLLKWTKYGKRRYFAEACATLTIQLLFYQATLVLTVFLFIGLFYRLLKRLLTRSWTEGEAKLLNRFMIVAYMTIVLGLLIISVATTNIIPKHLLPAEIFPAWSLPFLRNLSGILIDYFLFYAIGLFLAAYGFVNIIRSVWSSKTLFFNEFDNWGVILLIVTPLVWYIPNPAYTRHLLAPMVACFAAQGVKLLIEKRGVMLYVLSILMTAPFIVFFQLYNALWRNIEPYASISSLLFLILFFCCLLAESLVGLYTSIRGRFILGRTRSPTSKISKKMRDRVRARVFGYSHGAANLRAIVIVLFLLVFTITETQTKFVTEMDGRTIPVYVTEEEVAIADYIRYQQSLYSDSSILLCSHELIEHRIAAYAQTNCLSEGLGTALMETGYVTREDALQNSTFRLGNLLQEHWFEHIDPDRTLPQRPWFTIMTHEYSDPRVQDLLVRLHIRFFVGLRGTNESLYKWGGPFESLFRMTITAPIVFQTTSFVVYKLD